MTINFPPKSEAEVSNILPAGVYDAVVIQADERQRKATGAAMISLVVQVNDGNGKTADVNDWLLTDADAMAFKLRHFCRSAGILDKYETGMLDAADCDGRKVTVKLAVQDDPKYGEQNRISDYVQNSRQPPPVTPGSQAKRRTAMSTRLMTDAPEPPHGDDIPF